MKTPEQIKDQIKILLGLLPSKDKFEFLEEISDNSLPNLFDRVNQLLTERQNNG